jgi:glucosamine--fructose-6-phosphate aminotransferase (isomerizing)
VVCVATQGYWYEKMISNIQEVKARKGIIIALGSDGDANLEKIADEVIWIPPVAEDLSPMLTVIPLQLLAYYTAIKLGCDVDQPRNLAKSVTVE